MIRIPDPGRFELRLMDGSANPYLLQASVLAAGLDGLKNKVNPGKPLNCNMYEDYKKYPDLPKLPNELDQSLKKLENNEDMNDAFGKNAINSYIKLRSSEIKEFKQKEIFDKTKAITKWERDNTLDC
jgi:glutamine synthetase